MISWRLEDKDDQAPVVQMLDSAIHRINHYPADKYYRYQLRYLLDRALSGDSSIQRLDNRDQEDKIFSILSKACTWFTSIITGILFG